MKHGILLIHIFFGGLLLALAADRVRAEGSDELSEVIVIAQKRAQAAQDVPVTMQAYSAADLEAQSVHSAADLTKFTPGLNLGGAAAGQFTIFGIRGVVAQDLLGQAESPVATYVDEGYIAGHTLANVDIYDIDHVEVLKGPQGTLFGRNATGGVVNILNKAPSSANEGYLQVGYGSYNDQQYEGAFGGPITDTVRFRVAGMFQQNGDWVNNIAPTGDGLGNVTKGAGRVRLEYAPNDDFNILMTGYGSQWRYSWAPYFLLSTRNITNANGQVINSQIVNQPTLLGVPASNISSLTIDAPLARNKDGGSSLAGGTVKMTWNFGPTLTMITDAKRSQDHQFLDDCGCTADGNFINSIVNDFANSFSEEARLYKDQGNFRWNTGIYYLHNNAGSNPNWDGIGQSVAVADFNDLRTNSYSIFGQTEYDFANQWTLTTGIRGTKEKKEFDYHSDNLNIQNVPLSVDEPGTYVGPARPPYQGRIDDNLVTAKVGVDYKPANGTLLYAGWNRGERAGSFNAPAFGSTAYPDSEIPYKPETLNAFEMGEKSTFFNDRIRVNSALFYYDYQNYQSYRFVNLANQVSNLPAKMYGGELDVLAKPVRRLTTQFTASYTHDRVMNVTGVEPTSVTRVAPFTSAWKLSGLIRYGIDFMGGELGVQADADYTGSYYISITNYDTTRVGGYTLLNARVLWSNPLWQVEAHGSNLTDKRYETFGVDISSLCGCTQIGIGRPIWWGVSVRRNF